MSWKLWVVVLLLPVVALLAAPLWAPLVLRRVAWFEVERVEISGTGLLAAHEVLAASGIRRGANLWEEAGEWEEALRRHPVIASARVTRELPRTLRIRVEEERPIALVDEEIRLRLATAAGELLPLDPARVPLDLPLIRASAAGGDEQDRTTVLLAEAGRIAQLDPTLAARISEVSATAHGEVVLLLSRPAAEVLLRPGSTPLRLRQLRTVLEDLERGRAVVERPVRVDARFEDQVVVRF